MITMYCSFQLWDWTCKWTLVLSKTVLKIIYFVPFWPASFVLWCLLNSILLKHRYFHHKQLQTAASLNERQKYSSVGLLQNALFSSTTFLLFTVAILGHSTLLKWMSWLLLMHTVFFLVSNTAELKYNLPSLNSVCVCVCVLCLWLNTSPSSILSKCVCYFIYFTNWKN